MRRFLFLTISLMAYAILSFVALGQAEANAPDRLEESLKRLIARADSGNPRAMYDLAGLKEQGLASIEPDRDEAVSLYRRSAAAGFAPAQNYLGFMFYRGDMVEQNLDSAIYWIGRAAAKGDPKGANNMGWLLSEGRGVKHDYAKAAEWYGKAAKAGLPTAMAQLADFYRLGTGVAPDTAKAEQLYRKAIEAGLQDAENKLLAMIYPRFSRMGSEEALKLGIDLYTHRAPTAGVVLFEILAKKDNPRALAILGDAYTRAQGVEYNHEKSLDYYYRAAKWGNPSAQFFIGELIEIFPDALKNKSGYSPEERYPDYWYDKAAQQGVRNAEQAFDAMFILP